MVLKASAAETFRPRGRIIAIRMSEAFTVETDVGMLDGRPGDWLAIPHPDDGSDVGARTGMWPISAGRMRDAYERVGRG